MKCQVHGKTDVGRARTHNEDYYLIDPDLGLYVVCDGMGGHNGGDIASRLTADVMVKEIRAEADLLKRYGDESTQELREAIRGLLRRAVEKASRTVWEADDRTSSEPKSGMGTTLAMVLVCGRFAFVVHVGDSRVYLIRRGNMHQLTEDHSLVNEMVKHGMLGHERARNYPYANFITRAVGIQPEVEPDILHIELMNGDRYLLCTDGLTSSNTDQELLDAIRANELEQLPDVLVFMANEAGGADNITAVVIGIGEEASEATIEHTDLAAKKIETLSSIPLFAAFEYSELVKLLDIIEMRTANADYVVIYQGDLGDAMYVLLRGSAGVYKREQLINELGPGEFFGELSLIDDVPRSATVAALTPLVFLMLDRPRFFAYLDSNPKAAVKIYRAFLKRTCKQLRAKDEELYRLRRMARQSTEPSLRKSETISPADILETSDVLEASDSSD